MEREQGGKYILISSPASTLKTAAGKRLFLLASTPFHCRLAVLGHVCCSFILQRLRPQPPTPQHPAHAWPNRHSKGPNLSSMGAPISSACVRLLPPPPPPHIVPGPSWRMALIWPPECQSLLSHPLLSIFQLKQDPDTNDKTY